MHAAVTTCGRQLRLVASARCLAEGVDVPAVDSVLFADPRNEAALKPQASSLAGALKAHFGRIGTGDYTALLAYIERSPAHIDAMQRLRCMIRDRTKAATCVGFGPRFQHSTGQAYKGGPNSGVFLQITCDDPEDLPVPGQSYTFGIVKEAQARGDFEVLAERARRALRARSTVLRSRASPAWAPSPSPTSWLSDAGVQISVEAE